MFISIIYLIIQARFQEDDFVDSTSAKQLEDATGIAANVLNNYCNNKYFPTHTF